MNLLTHLRNVFPDSGAPIGFGPVTVYHAIDIDSRGTFLSYHWHNTKTPEAGGLFAPEYLIAPVVNRTSGVDPRLLDSFVYTFGTPLDAPKEKSLSERTKAATVRHEAFVARWYELRDQHANCCTVNTDYIEPLLTYVTNADPASPLSGIDVGPFAGNSVVISVNGRHPFTYDNHPEFAHFIESQAARVDREIDTICSVCGVGVEGNWIFMPPLKLGTAPLMLENDLYVASPTCGTCMTEVHSAWASITRRYRVSPASKGLRAKNRPKQFHYLYSGDADKVPSTGKFVDESARDVIHSVLFGGDNFASGASVNLDNRIVHMLTLTEMSSGAVVMKSLDHVPAADAITHATTFDSIRRASGSRPAGLVEMTDLLELDLGSFETTWRYAVLGETPPSSTLSKVAAKFLHVADTQHDPSIDFGGTKGVVVERRQKIRQAIIHQLLTETQEGDHEMSDIARARAFGRIAQILNDMHWNYHRDNTKNSIIVGNLSAIAARPDFMVTVLLPRAVRLNGSAKRSGDGRKASTAGWLDTSLQGAIADLAAASDLLTPLSANERAEFIVAFYTRPEKSNSDQKYSNPETLNETDSEK